MDAYTIEFLNRLTTEFYAAQAESFSATRHSKWTGWEKLVPYVKKNMASRSINPGDTYSILDLAAGNLRFEHFIAGKFPNLHLAIRTVDNNSDLVSNSPFELDAVEMHHLNVSIINDLVAGLDPCETPDNTAFDLACSFGFMHHIPSYSLRLDFINHMIDHTQKDGLIVLSFWQFMYAGKFAVKAIHETNKALEALQGEYPNLKDDLQVNDYMLGWKETENTYRYCHHFDDEEIDELLEDLGKRVEVVGRYNSDGRGEAMNCYLVLQKVGI